MLRSLSRQSYEPKTAPLPHAWYCIPVVPEDAGLEHAAFMPKRKHNKPRKRPAKKRLATSSRLPQETTQVVADIVHTLSEKQFGAKLAQKDN
jgi:hypothetical protein